MFDLEITGDAHPKRVMALADEDGRAKTVDLLADQWGTDDNEVMYAFKHAGACSDGTYRVVIPTDTIGDFRDLIEDTWPEAWEKLEELRADAEKQAEEAATA